MKGWLRNLNGYVMNNNINTKITRLLGKKKRGFG